MTLYRGVIESEKIEIKGLISYVNHVLVGDVHFLISRVESTAGTRNTSTSLTVQAISLPSSPDTHLNRGKTVWALSCVDDRIVLFHFNN